jgi:hypothetical protein
MGFTRRGNGKGRTRNGNDRTDNGGRTWQWVMRGGGIGKTKQEMKIPLGPYVFFNFS